MTNAHLFNHGSNAFILMKFPTRRESVFELNLPEHWGSPRTSAIYGDRVRVHSGANTVHWDSRDGDRCRAVWTPGGEAAPWDRDWSYLIDYEGHPDFVDIRMELTYRGTEPWDGPNLLACLRNRMADPFIDPPGKRTYLYTATGPVAVHDFVHGQFSEHRMMGAAVSPNSEPTTIQYPLMTTFDVDGTHACAMAFVDATSCSGNFGVIHCIHSNPSICNMTTGETRILRGRVYCMVATDPNDVLDRWLADQQELAE